MAERAAKGVALPYLRLWREYRLQTQADLAEHSGLSKITITRAEAGERISFTNIHKLAAAVGISAETLLRETPGQQAADERA